MLVRKFFYTVLAVLLLSACGGGGSATKPDSPIEKNDGGGSGGGGDSGGGGGSGGGDGSGGGGGSDSGDEASIVRPTNLKQFKAVGWDKIKYTGKGQKIGISESDKFGDLTEYNSRMKMGLQFATDGTPSSYKPAKGEVGGNHPAMTVSLAVGKNYGIAPEAYLYPYRMSNDDKSIINMKAIYDHAVTNGLVAVSNSWGDSYRFSKRIWDGIKADTSLREKGESGEDVVEKVSGMTSIAPFSYEKDGNSYSILGFNLCSSARSAVEKKRSGTKVLTSDKNGDFKLEPSLNLLEAVEDLACKGGYSSYMTKSYYEERLGKDFFDQLEDDADNNREDKPIWVWAAGNAKETNTDGYASAVGKYAKLKNYWLAVVNINTDYKQHNDSASCGKAKEYCLGAIGNGASSVDENGDKDTAGGTSAAAPQVAAGLAVIKSRFPTKTNVWVRQRMLATAKHETADGVKLKDRDNNVVNPDSNGLSDEFGRGIMRLDLAVKPTSPTTLSTGGDNLYSAKHIALATTGVTSSPAFGNGFKAGLAGVKTKVFDKMGASFDYDLNNRASVYNSNTTVFYNATKNNLNQFNTGINSTSVKYTNKNINPYANSGDINFSYNIKRNLSVSYITNRKSKNTLQVNKKLDNLYLSAGIVYEKGTLLGAKLSGGFKTNPLATTQYIKAGYTTNIANYYLSTSAVYGLTQSNSSATMLSLNKVHSFTSNLILSKGNWNFALKMPLRVIQAKGKIKYVDSVSKGKNNNDNLHYTTKTINLKPTGKHMIFNAIYKKDELSVGVVYHKDKDHIPNNNEKIVFGQYTIQF